MCNACGFYCCAYDGFSGCGCDHCPNPACWPDDPDEDDDDEFFCHEIVVVGDGLHTVLATALKTANREKA